MRSTGLKEATGAIAALLLAAGAAECQEKPKPFRNWEVKDVTPRGRILQRYDFHEVTIALQPGAMNNMENPYTDAEMTVVYTKSGDAAAPVRVPGFYYGFGQYRARALLLEEGAHSYSAEITRTGTNAPLKFTGSFSVRGASRDLSKGPLMVSEKNPIWLADRNGEPFFLAGVWAHSGLDAADMAGLYSAAWQDVKPGTFNGFYEAAKSNGFIDGNGAPTNKYFKEMDGLLDYFVQNRINMVNITADHMAWGFQTASNWHGKKAGEFKEPYRYDPNSGLIWDYFLASARRKGIYVKINLQEFCQGKYDQHPFNAIDGVNMSREWEQPDDMVTNAGAVDAWKRWVRYIVSRYSAYNNVHFQMGNEPPGDGYRLGQDRWKEFDRMTMETVKEAASYPVLYASGAPVGTGQLDQADYDVDHHNNRKFGAASCFFIKRNRQVPYHVEEIEAYNGRNGDEWVTNCRYLKFVTFVQGAYASALVMWRWRLPGRDSRIMEGFLASSRALHAFVEPVLPELFELNPDDGFIETAPAEIARGLRSEKRFIVYLQKRDKNSRNAPLPEELVLKLPDGRAVVEWFDTQSGKYLPALRSTVKDGKLAMRPPATFNDDIALRVTVEQQ
ncbi:MAG TPA: DUF5060 domain-containing protein [Planctomycetes bacterium]|nr:DUF5060 domain-containing protein [Planctomycetota bacterium]